MSLRNLFLCLLLASLTVPVFAEGDEPTVNDQAEEFAKEFRKGIKGLTEGQLLEGVDTLTEYYMNAEVDDKGARKAIMDALVTIAGHHNKAVVAHFVKTCEKLDEGVVKLVLMILQKELKARPPSDQVYEPALDTLGKLHSEDPKVVKTITNLFKHKDSSIIARAFYATSLYRPASGNTRKDMFEEVLKQTEGTYSSSQGNDETAKRKWTIVGRDAMDALNALSVPPRTGENFPNPSAARTWYNDNKKIPWDPRD